TQVIQRAEIRERQIGKTPVEGVSGNTIDPEKTLDVLLKCVEVRCSRTAPVVVDAYEVHQPAKRPDITESGVHARRPIRSTNRWIRIVHGDVSGTNLQTEIDIPSASARPAASSPASESAKSAASPATASETLLLLCVGKRMIEPDVDIGRVV